MKRAVLTLVSALAVLAPLRAQNRVAFAEVEIEGPFQRAVVLAGEAGSTLVEGAVGVGETRRVLVPIPVDPDIGRREPTLAAGSARTRFIGWKERDERLAQLPAALRARPAPLAEPARVRASVATLLVLAAAAIVGLWLARSWRAALALATVASIPAFLLARAAFDRDVHAVEVLDGVAGSSTWQRTRAAWDEIVLPSRGASFDLVTVPMHSLKIAAPLDLALPTRARARSTQLIATWPESWPEDALARTSNDLAPLAAAWMREEGNWTFRGPWELGAALGPAVPGGPPPGWLVAGLPQSVEILVGQVAGAARSFVRCSYP